MCIKVQTIQEVVYDTIKQEGCQNMRNIVMILTFFHNLTALFAIFQ